ncbi:MAG: glycosyl hydrolase [Gemmatimonadaceae bacterium]
MSNHRCVLVVTAALGVNLFVAGTPEAARAQRPRTPPLSTTTTPLVTPVVDTTLYQALDWRLVGPFRGGRAVTITGVPSQPMTFYLGTTGGGVWKTDDAGMNWRNITDSSFKTGSVGAIAVAEDDPNVVYVGMGEHPVRGVASSHGDGVYKSLDAGRTWTHLGLDATKQISAIVVHPKNSDIVFVAAQGSRWAPTEDRGIYKSTDGGKTFRKVLFVDPKAGASALSMDPTNPRVMYAAFWEHQRLPWQVRSGGPNSGIWKTTDGGETWKRLTSGLPKVMGKIGVAVSPANPDRVFAIIEATDGGFFRSDDAGENWRRLVETTDVRARSWYYMNVFADPKNADVVYIMNAPIWKSIDGGRSFQVFPAMHGDNHWLWINPDNPQTIANANDGGGSITLNGGRSWSTQNNQPTAQFYRINADDMPDYYVYSGQQDNSSVAIKSRVFGGSGIGDKNWEIHGGCESAHIAFDPKNPRFTYANCYQGIIEEYDRTTGMTRNVQSWPALGLAEPSDQQKYRFNWNSPVMGSPHDGTVIYHGANVLFRSNDRGFSWSIISPDLTKNDKSRQGLGGFPITNEGAGGEVYGTIFAVSESPVQRGVIWVGTDDGNVQVTRDDGKSWANVTPKNGPNDAIVNAIDPSHFDAGIAYIALMRYKWNDDQPYLFKTTDYGQTWTKITNGIPAVEATRVVREDNVKRGLLYAGTERGAYVSFDDGANWQSLQRNLPHVPVTDLKVHHDDLAISTEGRAFWIMDDITPLREMSLAPIGGGPYLFKPKSALRIDWAAGSGNGQGRNPTPGGVIRYALTQTADSTREVKLEIADAAGNVVRTYSSKPDTTRSPRPQGGPPGGGGTQLPVKKGMNSFAWDLRSNPPVLVPGLFLPDAVIGYRVAPGQYTVRLTAEGKTLSQSLTVIGDPRVNVSESDRQRAVAAAKAIWQRMSEIHQSVLDLRNVRGQVKDATDRSKGVADAETLVTMGKSLAARADTVDESMAQAKTRNGQDIINFRNGISSQFAYLQSAIDNSDAAPTKGMTDRTVEVEAQWAQIRTKLEALMNDIEKFNALLKEKGVPGIVIPKKTIS